MRIGRAERGDPLVGRNVGCGRCTDVEVHSVHQGLVVCNVLVAKRPPGLRGGLRNRLLDGPFFIAPLTHRRFVEAVVAGRSREEEHDLGRAVHVQAIGIHTHPAVAGHPAEPNLEAHPAIVVVDDRHRLVVIARIDVGRRTATQAQVLIRGCR